MSSTTNVSTEARDATIISPIPVPQLSENIRAPPVEESASKQPLTEKTIEEQTHLTEMFTQSEWTALHEFRKELPSLLQEAYSEKENAGRLPFKIWGLEIDPTKPNADPRTSVVLMKFLRARNLSVSSARDMLVATLRWREEFNVDAALKEEFPEEVFGKVGRVYGKDKGGRPVVYNIYGGNKDLKAVFGDVQRFLRWRVALMERTIAELDFRTTDQTLQVHDYEGVSLTSRDANSKQAASEASSIFQNHYPELLYRKFFINVPSLLNWIFWAFKPLISANTLAKMTVVGTGSHAISKALSSYIDAQSLPRRYGGQSDAF